MQNFFARIIPFILLGIAIVAFAFGLILLTYLLIFGALVGLVLFAISWLKNKFFPPKHLTKPQSTEKTGRTIEHDK